MKKNLKLLFGVALGVFLLWLVFRDTNWSDVLDAVRTVDYFWLAMTLIPIVASFFLRIQRWTYVVRTAGNVRYRTMFSATQIGFLANTVLPGRVGELVRALVLARLSQLSFSKSLAMAALDRVNDLIGLIVVLAVSVYVFQSRSVEVPKEILGHPLPENVINSLLYLSTLAVAGLIGAFVMLYINQRFALWVSDRVFGAVSKRLAERLHGMLEQFAEGLHIFRSAGEMAKSVFFSLLTWACFIIGNQLILLAFHIHAPWYTPFVFTTFVAIAVSIPGAPGFIGQFHFAVVATLSILAPDVPLENAKALALVAHVLNIIPIVVLGMYALSTEHLSLTALQRDTREAQSSAEL